MQKISEKHAQVDATLVQVAKSIKLLSTLTWPMEQQTLFLENWNRSTPKLPSVSYPEFDLSSECQTLVDLAKSCDIKDPIGQYLQQSALSYYYAARMLRHLATPEFLRLSHLLYGGPRDHLGKATNVQFAEEFISITDDIHQTFDLMETTIVPQEEVVSQLQSAAHQMFGVQSAPKVVVDRKLTSKAAAGAERIRIRDGAQFSELEVLQLIEHEIFVHTATAQNGRSQPYLKSLALGAPRTTYTQEGLATFGELITATMDLHRLRRIALRIKGIDLACSGGDFIEVFKFFLDAGQSQTESFQSASRIFRGAHPKGKFVFTKDVVYLKGLFSVHTFLRKAIEQRKVHYPEILFCGRMTVGDVLTLEPCIDEGIIQLPKFKPRWITNRDCLAAYLSYAAFANRLRLENIHLEDFVTQLELPKKI